MAGPLRIQAAALYIGQRRSLAEERRITEWTGTGIGRDPRGALRRWNDVRCRREKPGSKVAGFTERPDRDVCMALPENRSCERGG